MTLVLSQPPSGPVSPASGMPTSMRNSSHNRSEQHTSSTSSPFLHYSRRRACQACFQHPKGRFRANVGLLLQAISGANQHTLADPGATELYRRPKFFLTTLILTLHATPRPPNYRFQEQPYTMLRQALSGPSRALGSSVRSAVQRPALRTQFRQAPLLPATRAIQRADRKMVQLRD